MGGGLEYAMTDLLVWRHDELAMSRTRPGSSAYLGEWSWRWCALGWSGRRRDAVTFDEEYYWMWSSIRFG